MAKKERLRHYANLIASHAEASWVGPFFGILFFFDSMVLVLPSDSLLSAVIAINSKHVKKWLVYATIGFALGLALTTFLAVTHLQPLFVQWMERLGYGESFHKFIGEIREHGYWGLTVGVFTIVPCLFAVLAGAIVGLKAWAVWLISLGGKYLKLYLTVWLVLSSSNALKKWVKAYLKTSV